MSSDPSREGQDGPSVSFLCTAYKTERYLPATIRSVLAQTRQDWELVVVDNGMSDPIRDIVESFPDPRIVLVRQENNGMEAGVQAAAEAASGRYFAVLNSDDQVMPGYVERLAGLLDDHPDVDAVACDAYVLDDNTGRYRRGSFLDPVLGRRGPRFSRPVTLSDVVGGAKIYYTAAVRREAWEEAGGYEEGPGLVDTAMWLRMLRAGRDIRMVPDRLGIFLYRNDSLSRSPDSVAAFQAKEERAYVDGAAGSTDPATLEALARVLRRLRYTDAMRRARWAFLDGDVDRARAEADQAVAYRRTARSLAVAGALRTAPGVLTRLWPIKQELTKKASIVASRLSGNDAEVRRNA